MLSSLRHPCSPVNDDGEDDDDGSCEVKCLFGQFMPRAMSWSTCLSNGTFSCVFLWHFDVKQRDFHLNRF